MAAGDVRGGPPPSLRRRVRASLLLNPSDFPGERPLVEAPRRMSDPVSQPPVGAGKSPPSTPPAVGGGSPLPTTRCPPPTERVGGASPEISPRPPSLFVRARSGVLEPIPLRRGGGGCNSRQYNVVGGGADTPLVGVQRRGSRRAGGDRRLPNGGV